MPNRPLFDARWTLVAALAFGVGAGFGPTPAKAQLALPGAVAPSEEGAIAEGVHTGGGQSGATGAKKKRVAHTGGGGADPDAAAGAAVAPKPPSEDMIAGKPLYLDGSRSSIEFTRFAGETRISKLTLMGDRISKSGETCRVEAPAASLKLVQRDGDQGVRRYLVDYPACPFSFDVLDGAVLVSAEHGACSIAASDCRIDPNGLWGQGNAEFDPKNAKDMLSRRARVEKTIRADFKTLYAKNKKDKPLRSLLVREQAGFSARREEICRNYAQEADFGYCALRVTEAHALKLGTELAEGVKRPPDLPLEEPRKKGRIGK
jgi:hypothetical protein